MSCATLSTPNPRSEAAAALAHLHGLSLPQSLPVTADVTYYIPTYSVEALIVEVELLLDWYAPHVAHVSLTSGAKATFSNLWRHVLRDIVNAESEIGSRRRAGASAWAFLAAVPARHCGCDLLHSYLQR